MVNARTYLQAGLIHFRNTGPFTVPLFASTFSTFRCSRGVDRTRRIYTGNNCAGGYAEAGSERDSQTTVTIPRPFATFSEPRRYCFPGERAISMREFQSLLRRNASCDCLLGLNYFLRLHRTLCLRYFPFVIYL